MSYAFLYFFLGLFVGCAFGVFTMAIFIAGSRRER
jgi:hypothetical protein